jgi:RNA-binding protein
MKLKGSQRTYLRGLAHKLKPVVQVGRNGVSDDVLAAVREALDCHELIKLKFMEYKEQKDTLASQIAEQTDSELVGRIGNMAILYREQPDPERRKIVLPKIKASGI